MYPNFFLFVLLPLFGFSQAPQKINFQSILRNTNGEVVSNKSVSLKIFILSGSISGLTVYGETHTKTTDASGLISLQIGNGTVLSGVFSDIAWGDFPHFIKLEADFSGGNNFVLLGSQELMSVPYALYASKTDTSSLNLVNRLNVKVNISDTSNMLLNYRTGLNNKVNIADTSSMLKPYLRKSDSIIADLQKQVELLSSYTSLLASGLVDIDGNNYSVVKIGNQIWMKENLRVSRYNNGDSIPNITDNTEWSNLLIGARSWVNNDTLHNIPYGNLYNWYAVVDNRNVCPAGWHVPSDTEWTAMILVIDGIFSTPENENQSLVAGGRMKSTGTTFWYSPNKDATNMSGFSAFPAGYRTESGGFGDFRRVAIFWSATENGVNSAWNRLLYNDNSSIYRYNYYYFNKFKSNGASVRCIKDL